MKLPIFCMWYCNKVSPSVEYCWATSWDCNAHSVFSCSPKYVLAYIHPFLFYKYCGRMDPEGKWKIIVLLSCCTRHLGLERVSQRFRQHPWVQLAWLVLHEPAPVPSQPVAATCQAKQLVWPLHWVWQVWDLLTHSWWPDTVTSKWPESHASPQQVSHLPVRPLIISGGHLWHWSFLESVSLDLTFPPSCLTSVLLSKLLLSLILCSD